MSQGNNVVVIGAGGYSKVVIAVFQLLKYNVICILDDDKSKHGTSIFGVIVAGTIDTISQYKGCNAFIAIGNNSVRKMISIKYSKYCNWISVVHPSAILYPEVKIGEGSFIRANVVIQPNVNIGAHCMISSNSTVSHDCTIQSYCYLAPNCAVGGESLLAEGVMMGIGSTVNNSLEIGKWSIVGAQAAVVRSIPSFSLAVGVPAFVKKELK